MIPLQNRLTLHRFICREFGYDDMRAMLERLRDVPARLDASGGSGYAHALYPNPARANITSEQLSTYDANIAAHSRRLRMTGEHGREWKPYQYLALLFTEHYLNRQKYERSEARVTLPNPGEADAPVITLDLDSQLQSVASGEVSSASSTQKTSVELEPRHTSFFNQARIYDTLLRRKQQNGWHNLTVRPETVECLLQEARLKHGFAEPALPCTSTPTFCPSHLPTRLTTASVVQTDGRATACIS